MQFLFLLLILFTLGITGLLFYLIYILKNDDYDKTINILNFFAKIGLLVLIVGHALITIISLFFVNDSFLVFILIIKQIIVTSFYISVYIQVKSLLNNLVAKKIFMEDNIVLTKRAGLLFIYLSLTEMITGLVLGVIFTYDMGNFNITTNNIIIIYIIIGLVLQIVSKILDAAIKVYNEHQLTI